MSYWDNVIFSGADMDMVGAEDDGGWAAFWKKSNVFPPPPRPVVDVGAEQKRQREALIGTEAELNLATQYMAQTGDCSWDFARAFAKQHGSGVREADGMLRLVSTGSKATRRANEYRYEG
jgi:hypothetical protein